MLTEFLMSSFVASPTFIELLQVVLDLMILIALVLFLFMARRQKLPSGTDELFHGLEKIVEETKNINKEFDTNLQERQSLIQQILTKLEHKIQEAQKVCERLEALQKAQPAPSDSQASSPAHSDHKKVLILFQKGMDAKAIAKRLQKPIGEVELILDIQRLSTDQ